MKRIGVFIAMFALWCLLSRAVDAEHIFAGVLVGAIVTFLGTGLPANPGTRFRPANLRYLALVALLLLRDMTVSFAITAYRLVQPAVMEDRGDIEVQTSLESDQGRTILAIAVNMVPGALAAGIREDGKCMNVQLVDVGTKEKVIAAIRNYEALLTKVFG